jgi:hypothetical protein
MGSSMAFAIRLYMHATLLSMQFIANMIGAAAQGRQT